MTEIYNKVELKDRRRDLRKKATNEEMLLWNELRNGNFHRFKFKRQYSVDGYVLDFYCPKQKLAIELDGIGHENSEEKAYDQERTEILKQCNIRVIRFKNKDIVDHLESVLDNIKWILTSPPSPLLGKERGSTRKAKEIK